MASFPVHLGTATVLGTAYGCAAAWYLNFDWGPVFLGAGLTALGGMLPDLDSDSGVPVRELFGLSAAVVAVLLFRRVLAMGFTAEQTVVVLAGAYLFVRYVVADVFKRATVHRGMFHSIPALLIAGLAVYLLDARPDLVLRAYLAGGVMLGFLSHLVLDELYSIDFNGVRLHLNKYAGSAVKFTSPSWGATAAAYLLLGALGWLAWRETAQVVTL
jgi:hypothetical protein